MNCPECGSNNVAPNGERDGAAYELECGECGCMFWDDELDEEEENDNSRRV